MFLSFSMLVPVVVVAMGGGGGGGGGGYGRGGNGGFGSEERMLFVFASNFMLKYFLLYLLFFVLVFGVTVRLITQCGNFKRKTCACMHECGYHPTIHAVRSAL